LAWQIHSRRTATGLVWPCMRRPSRCRARILLICRPQFKNAEKNMKRTLATSLFVLLSGCATTTSDMPTQQGVDLQRYAGTWYEQARLPNRFQDDCVDDVK